MFLRLFFQKSDLGEKSWKKACPFEISPSNHLSHTSGTATSSTSTTSRRTAGGSGSAREASEYFQPHMSSRCDVKSCHVLYQKPVMSRETCVMSSHVTWLRCDVKWNLRMFRNDDVTICEKEVRVKHWIIPLVLIAKKTLRSYEWYNKGI